MEVALARAQQLAAGPALSLAAAKRLVHRGLEVDLATAIAMEREVVTELFDSADRVEGVSAFLEKREPNFGAT